MKRPVFWPLLFLSILLTLLSAGCAGTPSGKDAADSSVQASVAESPEIPAAADPDYDPTVNQLVHQGWAVSMPPDWRAATDISNKGSYLFRLSYDQVRISVQPVDFDFEIDPMKLNDYIEKQLDRTGKVSRNENLEASSVSRKCSFVVWDVELERGGLHRVILEENEQGMFEWRITVPTTKESLFNPVVMRIFSKAEFLENMEVSRRIQESGFEFSSQGGLWRWCGDLDQGFLLESYVSENDPYAFMTITTYESLIKVSYKAEDWVEKKKDKSDIRNMEISYSGRPEKTRLWIQNESDKKKEALFFAGTENPILFFLDLRLKKGRDSDVNAFLEGDSFRNLLEYSVKFPGGGL